MYQKIFLYLLLLPLSLGAQKTDTVYCENIQVVTTRSTIEGFPFTTSSTSTATNSYLRISKDFFKQDFKLISSDPNWPVDGFWYTMNCRSGKDDFNFLSSDPLQVGNDYSVKQGHISRDFVSKFVKGSIVNINKHPLFRYIEKGDLFEFSCINITRNGKRYLTQNFLIIVE